MADKCISQQTYNDVSIVVTNRMFDIDEQMEHLVKRHITRQYSRSVIKSFDQDKIDELNAEKTRLNNILADLQKCRC